MNENKMKVEIWGDITCHHCYITKKSFETALANFKDRESVDVIWRSFELGPDLITDSDTKLPAFLSSLHGISEEHAKGMTDQLVSEVKQKGFEFNLDIAIPANSFKAHRLMKLAKTVDLQSKLGERLFRAYYTEGKNVDDVTTLIQLAVEVGLNEGLVQGMFENNEYTDQVKQDLNHAKQVGITSVPYYVFNDSIKLNGTQSTEVYLTTLKEAFQVWELKESLHNGAESCNLEQGCI